MSVTLKAQGISGESTDFFAFNEAGLVWNGSAFVAWADVDYVTYRIAATEQGTSGGFVATGPDLTERYVLRVRAGTIATSFVRWTETVERGTDSAATAADYTAARAAKLDNLDAAVSTLGTLANQTTMLANQVDLENITPNT